MKRKNFTMIEMMVVIAVILLLMALVGPVIQKLMIEGKKAQGSSAARDLVTTMKMYGEGNKKGKLPYPVSKADTTVGSGPNGSVAWGEPNCLSKDVVKLMLEENYIKRSEVSILTVNARGDQYIPLTLGPDQDKIDASQTPRWDEDQELDFQVYANKYLTTAGNSKKVMVISYDNEYLPDCHFNGQGWIVGFLGGEAGFKRNAWYSKFDVESGDKTKLKLVDEVANVMTEAKKADPSVKDFATRISTATAPGGGSTELIGFDESSAIYKALIGGE